MTGIAYVHQCVLCPSLNASSLPPSTLPSIHPSFFHSIHSSLHPSINPFKSSSPNLCWVEVWSSTLDKLPLHCHCQRWHSHLRPVLSQCSGLFGLRDFARWFGKRLREKWRKLRTFLKKKEKFLTCSHKLKQKWEGFSTGAQRRLHPPVKSAVMEEPPRTSLAALHSPTVELVGLLRDTHYSAVSGGLHQSTVALKPLLPNDILLFISLAKHTEHRAKKNPKPMLCFSLPLFFTAVFRSKWNRFSFSPRAGQSAERRNSFSFFFVAAWTEHFAHLSVSSPWLPDHSFAIICPFSCRAKTGAILVAAVSFHQCRIRNFMDQWEDMEKDRKIKL